MREPLKIKLKDRDFTVIARNVVEKAIGEHLNGSPLEVDGILKRLPVAFGGLKGGRARAKELTSKQRETTALKAAKLRWKK
jgi:hypothetical protein